MPAQTFVDDSGGKGQGRHFVLAGLLAHSEAWALFSDEWQACLNEPPRLRYFKMREAAGCKGEFAGLSQSERDDKLRSLARIINRYANVCIYSAIDLDAHKETWGTKLSKPFSEPYFYPFQNMVLATAFELWDIGWRERFEIIFDEHVIFAPRVKAWYPVIRDLMRVREPDAYSLMPIDLLFRKDDEFLPLQACDLFAWCLRKGSDETLKGAERPFEWLLEELRSVLESNYRQYYDRQRLESVLAMGEVELKKMRAGDDASKAYRAVFSKHRELFIAERRKKPRD